MDLDNNEHINNLNCVLPHGTLESDYITAQETDERQQIAVFLTLFSQAQSAFQLLSGSVACHVISLENIVNNEACRVLRSFGGSYTLWGNALSKFLAIEKHSFHPMSFFRNLAAVQSTNNSGMKATEEDVALCRMAEYVSQYNRACEEANEALYELLETEIAREKIKKTSLCEVVADFKVRAQSHLETIMIIILCKTKIFCSSSSAFAIYVDTISKN